MRRLSNKASLHTKKLGQPDLLYGRKSPTKKGARQLSLTACKMLAGATEYTCCL